MFSSNPPRGQGMVEYGLVIMLVAIIVILVIVFLGPAVANLFSNVVAKI